MSQWLCAHDKCENFVQTNRETIADILTKIYQNLENGLIFTLAKKVQSIALPELLNNPRHQSFGQSQAKIVLDMCCM